METTDPSLDALDLRILEILQDDVTTPNADIAERLSSSKTVIWRRIQRLMETGVIRGRVAILDHQKIGLGVLVFAQVKMGRHGHNVLPAFIEAVGKFPQVIECHLLMGHVDFLLKILVPSIAEYERFIWQDLSQVEGVQEVTSAISMSQRINTTKLPLSRSLIRST